MYLQRKGTISNSNKRKIRVFCWGKLSGRHARFKLTYKGKYNFIFYLCDYINLNKCFSSFPLRSLYFTKKSSQPPFSQFLNLNSFLTPLFPALSPQRGHNTLCSLDADARLKVFTVLCRSMWCGIKPIFYKPPPPLFFHGFCVSVENTSVFKWTHTSLVVLCWLMLFLLGV